MTKRWLLAVVAMAAMAAAPDGAGAAVFGSSSLATVRSCAARSATQACIGGPDQPIAERVYGGGLGLGGTTDLTTPDGYARATVGFGDFDLPEIRTETRADGNVRFNINTFAFQSYVYTGDADTAFSLSASLHIVDSSSNLTSTGDDFELGGLPGGARYSAYLAVWDPSVLGDFTTAKELNDNLFYASCNTAGVLGTVGSSAALPGGEQSFGMTTIACSDTSLILKPGQEVLVVAGLQLPVNRGGFVDATRTFSTRFGDDLSAEQQAILATSLVSASSTVPEPTSWAMLIVGLGLTGARLRRRSVRSAAA